MSVVIFGDASGLLTLIWSIVSLLLQCGGPRRTEIGPDGLEQEVLPGAEQISQAELLQRRADEPLKPRAAQTRDFGLLFSDESRQLDLIDMAKEAGEAVDFPPG